MNELKRKIEADFKESFKNRDVIRSQTLRMVLAAIHNREIEKRGRGNSENSEELTEEEVLEVIRREAKKRKEAIELYTKGGRPELAEQETAELEIIKKYLPQELSDGELENIISEVMAKVKPQSDKDFGKVMGEVMKLTKGRADSKKVGELVRQKLAAP